MKTIITYLLVYFFRFVLWFRYRLRAKGLEKLNPEILNKPGGVIFLPTHPTVFVDPLAVGLEAWKKYPIRPMIVEYMYYMPVVNTVMKFLDALPVPNFSNTSNSLKRRKGEQVIQDVITGLKNKQNFLLYPAGRVKLSAYEAVGGASAVHQILQEAPEANVVLVRVKGLWGSSFSTYYEGKSPPMFATIYAGFKTCLRNLLFFTPRREIIIEFVPAPADFPYKASKVELNRYLEAWYNQPDGLMPQTAKLPGDSLVLVSYSMWGEKYLPVNRQRSGDDSNINLDTVPPDVKKKVFQKLAAITERPESEIKPDLNLSVDLGLDSLDVAELSAFLHDAFDVKGVPVNQLTTVTRMLGIASRQVTYRDDSSDEEIDIPRWKQRINREKLVIAQGSTVPEVFLNNCKRMGKSIACGDMRSGVLDYVQLKQRVILLAEYIRHLPGEYIGILLPASVAANSLILATQLAGKIPLMVNWTVGPRHLDSVVKLSNVQVVLTSWAFIDRLDNVDLTGIEDQLVMLEDVKREFNLKAKIRAYFRSKKSTESILKIFGIDKSSKDSPAVLLFTSGTENMPKGVPLSHDNIISNLRAVFQLVDVYNDDVLFGILPPFHAFGFAISALFGLLSGIKVASSPDPTDGLRIARGIEKWGVTILCGAPSFLKGILKAAKPEQLKTIRLCVTGAEKAPPELFQMMGAIGKETAILEGYGITECSPVLTVNPVDQQHRGVGLAIPGVEICIVHPETYEDVPIGGQGLILARGPNIFAGYLNKDVTSPFVEHAGKKWYKTGDLGFLDKEGYLTISGRQKRFIKIGGEMVSLASIEDALLEEGIRRGWPVNDEGPTLAICAKEFSGEKPKIYLFTSVNTNIEDINVSLKNAGFSNLVRISNIIPLREIPLMGSGKTNYRALEATLKEE